MICEDGEEKRKEFLKILNSCHPTIKFTAKYSLDKINFLDVEVYAVETNSLQIYTSNLRIVTNTQKFHLVTYIIVKNLFHIARLSVLIGFVQKIGFSIKDVINLSAGLTIEVAMKKLLDNKF